MLLEAAEHRCTFVDDPGVDPGWRESAEVSAFSTFVDAVFFTLLLREDGEPPWVYLFEDVLDSQKAVFGDGTVEFKDIVNGKLSTDRGLEFKQD